MAVRVPEVGREGLVLWRLHRPPNDVLCCLVGPSELGLLLVVRSEGRRLLVKAHRDVVKIVDRAETLKAAYIRRQWLEPKDSRQEHLDSLIYE